MHSASTPQEWRRDVQAVHRQITARLRHADPQRAPHLRKAQARLKQAEQALDAHLSQDEPAPATLPAGLRDAWLRGQAQIARWVADGILVPSQVFADAWAITPQALGKAAREGRLVAVKHAARLYYPAALMALTQAEVGRVNRALAGLGPSEQLLFWLRPHGALGGQTPAEALAGPRAAMVDKLAQAVAADGRAV